MRFRLTLSVPGHRRLLPFNYQYPLSAAIYKILESADEEYAHFLHNTGYGQGSKSFKLFTFSDIIMRYRVFRDRMEILDREASVIVCFHLPKAASSFITGIFRNQRLIVSDRYSKVCFEVKDIQLLPGMHESLAGKPLLLEPISALVAGMKNTSGNYDFIPPENPVFPELLVQNLIEKYTALHPLEETEKEILKKAASIETVFLKNPPKSRLITIKAFTPEETKIRGFTNFRLNVNLPAPLLELALNAGMGLYNAQGMGCAGIAGYGVENLPERHRTETVLHSH